MRAGVAPREASSHCALSRDRAGRSMSSLRRIDLTRTIVDKLFLRELKIETIIGFHEWERRIKQTVSIDLEIGADSRASAAVDTEAGALNYEAIARQLVEHVGAAQYRLVETLAEAVARIVIREFSAPWVKVAVAKPGAIPGARDVGIVIERSSADYG